MSHHTQHGYHKLQQQQQQQQQQYTQYGFSATNNEVISFDEVQRKIQDVLRGYDPSVNLERLSRVEDMRREVDRQCQMQQEQLRLITQKLQQRIDLARQAAERTEPVEEYQKRMDLLRRELHDIEASCNALDQQCRDVTEQIRSLGERLAQLEEDLTKYEASFSHEMHVLRAKERLYEYLVPVVWDKSSLQPDSGTVKGFFNFVTDSSDRDDCMEDDDDEECGDRDALHAFTLNEAEMSQFEITRHLWQIMYSHVN